MADSDTEEPDDVNRLQARYAASKDERLVGEIYTHAMRIARSRFGGWGNPERENFGHGTEGKKARLIHEYLWHGETDHLYRIVTDTLAGFNDSMKVKYSHYLTTAIRNMHSHAESYVNAQKREKRQHENTMPEDYEVATGDAAELAQGDPDLIDRLFTKLKAIHREYMVYYLAHHVEGKTYEEIAGEFDVTVTRVQQRLDHVTQRLPELLWSLYDGAIDNHTSTFDVDERAFGRCLQLALERLHAYYQAKKTEALPAALTEPPPHFITVEQLNTLLRREETPENLVEVAGFLAQLASAPDRKIEVGVGTPPRPAATVVGRYQKEDAVQLYCDPAIARYARTTLKTPDITDKDNLVSYVEFNNSVLRRDQTLPNLKEVSTYALQTLQTSPRLAECDNAPAEKLVGVYMNQGNRTIYISRKLGAHAMKALDVLPILEEAERGQYYSLTELVRILHHNSSHDAHKDGGSGAKELEAFLVRLRDHSPDEIVDKKSELTARAAIQTFRATSGQRTMYIRKEMMPYINYNYLERLTDIDRQHWITGKDVCAKLGTTPTPERLVATHKVLEELRAKQRDDLVPNTNPLGNGERKFGDVIRRFMFKHRPPTYYIEADSVIHKKQENPGHQSLITKGMIDAKAVELKQATANNPNEASLGA
jgi:hypothetical protein